MELAEEAAAGSLQEQGGGLAQLVSVFTIASPADRRQTQAAAPAANAPALLRTTPAKPLMLVKRPPAAAPSAAAFRRPLKVSNGAVAVDGDWEEF